MKLLNLVAINFRVFEKFEFTFPQESGLYLLTGDNRDRPELGSNGVGKSSLFDAIGFALYGQSLRRLKGADLIRDIKQPMAVTLATSNGVVSRGWAKDKKMLLTLDGQSVAQEEVTARFGLDAAMFSATTIIPQCEPLFADLPPTTQTATLQRLLSMERWVTYADRATKKSAALERLRSDVAQQLATVVGSLDGIDLESSQRQEEEWAATRERLLVELTAKINEIKDQEPPTPIEEGFLQLDSNIKRQESNLSVLEKQAREAAAEIRGKEMEAAGIEREIAGIDTELSFFNNNPTCPTCKQDITNEHLSRCNAVLVEKKVEAERRRERVNWSAAKKRGDLSECDTRIRETRTKITTAREAKTTALMKFERAKSEHAHWERRLADTQQRHDSAAKETNPFSGVVERATQRLASLEEQSILLRTEYEGVERQEQCFAVWSKGFKGIRSQMVSEALTQFTMDIAAVLEDLGLIGWQIAPYIDPAVFENARTQTGFKFAVTDPDGVERPLEAYSGGELQRVRLAIQLGLASLVASVSGVGWDFEVWDEPSTYMSEEGVLGLFRSLKDRALRLERPIWVIDHHQVHYGELDGVYQLVREGGVTELA